MKRLILILLLIVAIVGGVVVTGHCRVIVTARDPDASSRLGGGGAHTSPIGPKLNSQPSGGKPPGHP